MRNDGRSQPVCRIAREFGDFANNDEYFAIREEEAVLDARIARLEDMLTRATVVEPVDGHESVGVGSEVVVFDLDTGEERDYVLDSAHGAPGTPHVSPRSPVGRALLGLRAGERVRIQLPSGRVRELELREIRAPKGA
jgi:transcription elongation factor GreA